MPTSSGASSVAIIDAGFISEYHINGIRAAGDAEITCLVGRRANKTAERAAQLEIPHHSTHYHNVLIDPDIDAVVIATPDATHKSITIDALRAGKSVLLQKPMVINSEECAQILQCANETRTPLTVSFMHRYFAEVRWLRKQILHNTYGKIHSIRIRNATPGAD
jgi:predicted dehydrogenase